MTLESARSTAQAAAVRFGNTWIVYRFPGWPAACWGCRAEGIGLPPNAEIDRRFEPHAQSVSIEPAQRGLF